MILIFIFGYVLADIDICSEEQSDNVITSPHYNR